MALEQISSELSSRLIAMSEVEYDSSLSDEQRSQKLKQMKAETLEKINSEIPYLSISSQTIVSNIGKIVESEDWAKLPPPKKLANSIAVMNSTTALLVSFQKKMVVDMQQVMDFILQIQNEQKIRTMKAYTLALNHNFDAAQNEFRLANNSAEKERTSGYISGGVGIATAVLSVAAKSIVMKISSEKFKEAKLKVDSEEKTTYDVFKDQHQKTSKSYADANKDLVAAKTSLVEKEKNLQSLELEYESLPDVPENRNKRNSLSTKINEEKKIINDNKLLIQDHEAKIEKLKNDIKFTSDTMAPTQAAMEEANAEANRAVQELRAGNDLIDPTMSIFSNVFKFLTSATDYSAKKDKIDSDKASYDKNFSSSSMQNLQKELQDLHDGSGSCLSSFSANIQMTLSGESYAIKTA